MPLVVYLDFGYIIIIFDVLKDGPQGKCLYFNTFYNM